MYTRCEIYKETAFFQFILDININIKKEIIELSKNKKRFLLSGRDEKSTN